MNENEIVLNKLSGLITEKLKSKREFAKQMQLSERTTYLKLQGKIDFKSSEILRACEILDINDCDIPLYFFEKQVQKSE